MFSSDISGQSKLIGEALAREGAPDDNDTTRNDQADDNFGTLADTIIEQDVQIINDGNA